jgi:hypothetical protein
VRPRVRPRAVAGADRAVFCSRFLSGHLAHDQPAFGDRAVYLRLSLNLPRGGEVALRRS